jgi:hypothetical protein
MDRPKRDADEPLDDPRISKIRQITFAEQPYVYNHQKFQDAMLRSLGQWDMHLQSKRNEQIRKQPTVLNNGVDERSHIPWYNPIRVVQNFYDAISHAIKYQIIVHGPRRPTSSEIAEYDRYQLKSSTDKSFITDAYENVQLTDSQVLGRAIRTKNMTPINYTLDESIVDNVQYCNIGTTPETIMHIEFDMNDTMDLSH